MEKIFSFPSISGGGSILLDLSTPSKELWFAVLMLAIQDYGVYTLTNRTLFHFECTEDNCFEEVDLFFKERNGTFNAICHIISDGHGEQLFHGIRRFLGRATLQEYENIRSIFKRRKGIIAKSRGTTIPKPEGLSAQKEPIIVKGRQLAFHFE